MLLNICFSDEEGIWFVCEEITKYLKTNQSIISVFVYPLKFIMKFSPCASLKVRLIRVLYVYYIMYFS